MAVDGGLASQVFALAKDIGKVEKDVKTLSERDGNVQTALAQLGSVQEALDHLEERTTGLQAEVQALAPIRTGLDALGKTVKQLAKDLEALASTAEEKLAVWNFSFDNGMNKAEAAEAWDVLIRWVRSELQGTYGWVGWPANIYAEQNPTGYGSVSGGPVTPPRIPPCWYRHREAVVELGWLCQEWMKIYRTSYGTPSRAGDWHDRYAPGVKRRLITALTKCIEMKKHQDDEWANDPKHSGAPRAIDDDATLTVYFEWDRDQRSEPPSAGPVAAN
ncbi:hypothetical protein OG252_52230 (plasmid) [Streptomyces sp. NBC_01352]|uniref:hypothetical protein n=1 Tax=Streptomyces sp. NBC_01352 TaxID=2903834 RepID=UPI002E2F06D0|nr:hypothetical protein [Streptomyces sp. NBC_01352]